jgi:hypothetical protein
MARRRLFLVSCNLPMFTSAVAHVTDRLPGVLPAGLQRQLHYHLALSSCSTAHGSGTDTELTIPYRRKTTTDNDGCAEQVSTSVRAH